MISRYGYLQGLSSLAILHSHLNLYLPPVTAARERSVGIERTGSHEQFDLLIVVVHTPTNGGVWIVEHFSLVANLLPLDRILGFARDYKPKERHER